MQFHRRSSDTDGMRIDEDLFIPVARPPVARIVTSALLLLATFLMWRELEPTLYFRPVEGTVLAASFERVRIRRTRYVPVIYYRYEVDNQKYLGRNYRRTNVPFSRWTVGSFASRFVAGARVQVWYNPRNPGDSVLSRSMHPGVLLIFGLSSAITLWVWRKYSYKVEHADREHERAA
jgi:hypothetical protein